MVPKARIFGLELLHIFVNPWTGSILTHRPMDPYISIGKESIEKERIGIDRYIYRNTRKGNERRNSFNLRQMKKEQMNNRSSWI